MRNLCCGLFLLGLFLASPVRAAEDDFKLEPGFTLLFNGKNLDGWAMKTGSSLEGKSEAANGRFKVIEGTLILDPKVRGDITINTTRKLGKDTHIKFEFKPGPGCNNDLFFRGLKFDIVKGNVKNMKEGEWNTFEIIVKGDQAEFKCNGQSQRKAKVKNDASVLGVRAEFGSIQIRRMRAAE